MQTQHAVIVYGPALNQLLKVVKASLGELSTPMIKDLYILPSALETKIGEKLVNDLNLKLDKQGRVSTQWGTKTPVGLARTLFSQIEQVQN